MASAGRLYWRGSVLWMDFVASNGARIREPTNTNNELKAGLKMAQRKLEVEEGCQSLNTHQLAMFQRITETLGAETIEVLKYLLWQKQPAQEVDTNALEGMAALLKQVVLPEVVASGTATTIQPNLTAQIEALTAHIIPGAPKYITYGQLEEQWLKAKGNKRSIRDDKQRFKAICLHFGAGKNINLTTAADLDAYRETFYLDGAKPSPSTVNRYFALIRSAFNFAYKRGYQHQDPFKGFTFLDEDNARTRIASPDEYKALLKGSIKEPQLHLAIQLGYHLGLRVEETTEVGQTHELHLDAAEGPYVLLHESAVKDKTTTSLPIKDTALLKALRSGTRITWHPDTISHKFSELAKELGFKGLRFHDLRRTFVTNLRKAGVDPVTAMKLSRHKSLEVVQHHYSIVVGEDLREAAGKLDKHLNKRKPNGKVKEAKTSQAKGALARKE